AANKAIRAGHGLGPLHGVPIAVKDLVEFQGHVTTAGCAVWRQRVSQYTAPLVEPARVRTPTDALLPRAPPLDTPRPLARTVEDCALLLMLLQGPDAQDPLT